MQKIISYLLILSFMLLSGCVNIQKADHTPVHETEFKKPLEQLRAEYSDIELYESRWRGFPPKILDYDDLINKWGAPKRNEKLWGQRILGFALNGILAVGLLNLPVSWFLAIEAIVQPLPAEEHVWEKGSTEIKVFTNQNLFTGFDKRAGIWEWEKVHNSKE